MIDQQNHLEKNRIFVCRIHIKNWSQSEPISQPPRYQLLKYMYNIFVMSKCMKKYSFWNKIIFFQWVIFKRTVMMFSLFISMMHGAWWELNGAMSMSDHRILFFLHLLTVSFIFVAISCAIFILMKKVTLLISLIHFWRIDFSLVAKNEYNWNAIRCVKFFPILFWFVYNNILRTIKSVWNKII